MSRVGRKIIPLPAGVDVQLSQGLVRVNGPLGQLEWQLDKGVQVTREDDHLLVSRTGDAPHLRSMHGLTRAELNNCIEGVVKGFSRTLELTGVGYRVQMEGNALSFTVGYSHPVVFELPDGVQANVEKQTIVTVQGINKRLVTQVASTIRRIKSPDVYKQKGIKYQGEVLRKKAGKAGKK